MKRVIVVLMTAALVLLMAVGVFAQEADEWSQFQRDPRNSGYMDVTIPDSGKVSSQTGAIDAVDGSQPVVSGNRFYVYTSDGTNAALECYNLTTYNKVWEQAVDATAFGSWSSPAVSGGVAYIGSGSKVYAFKAENGSALWTRDLASLAANASIVNSSPTVEEDSLYIGDWENGIYYCLDVTDNGKKVWEFELNAGCRAQSTPAIDGARVFVGQFSDPAGTNGKVWCLDKSNGKPVTSWGTNGYFQPVNKLDVTGSVAVDGDYIYFTDYDFNTPNSHLYCLNKQDGKEEWKGSTLPSSGTPAVGEGIVVSAGQDWALWPPALKTTAFAAGSGSGGAAAPSWTVDDLGGWTMSAAIADGKVAVGIFDPTVPPWGGYKGVAVLGADDGSVVWQNAENGGSPPVPTEHGLLSIGGNGVTAFDTTTPTTSRYYFAEGTTRDGYQEWICLENPGGAEMDANIQYMMADGTTRDQAVKLPSESRTTVDVNLFLGPDCDVSARVTGDGYFVAERAMYVDTGTVSGGEQVMGVTDPGKSFLFAEGTTRAGYQTWLALQNPGNTDADVLVTYVYTDKAPKAENVTVKASSRRTIDVNLNAGEGEDVSMAVISNQPIVGERVMYFESAGDVLGVRTDGVHNSTGVRSAGESWYFAEGTTRYNFQEWLCLMNPAGQDVNATVNYLLADGTVLTETKVLEANSRTTVDVNLDVGPEQDVSIQVTADGAIVAERPMYFQYLPGIDNELWGGGHDTAGASYAAYRWEFAEGTTREGYVTYLCISNPNNMDAEVTIDYITSKDDGTKETITETVTVPGNSRYTIDVNNAVGADRDVSTVLTCGVPIVVERPMYFGATGFVGGGTSLGLPGTP